VCLRLCVWVCAFSASEFVCSRAFFVFLCSDTVESTTVHASSHELTSDGRCQTFPIDSILLIDQHLGCIRTQQAKQDHADGTSPQSTPAHHKKGAEETGDSIERGEPRETAFTSSKEPNESDIIWEYGIEGVCK
jgi:hypothetical protein